MGNKNQKSKERKTATINADEKKNDIKKNKAIFVIISIICALCLCFGVIFCVANQKKYSLITTDFAPIIGLNEDVDFTSLKIQNDKNQDLITATADMVISCDLTDTLGEKKLVIKYDGIEFETTFEVKYKVEFFVKGQVVDTQFVLSASEINMPSNPQLDGYEFIDWDSEIPVEITDNIQITAIMSSTTLAVPTLKKLHATYGDLLSDLTLPSNDNGEWIFVDDTAGQVGDCGVNRFNVKFEPKTTELVEKYDIVEIEVAQKELTFNITTTQFVYDGEAHYPEYTLSEDVDVKVNVILGEPQTNVSDTSYQYAYMIDDENYSGYISGYFDIVKANVTVEIKDKQIDYGTTANMEFEVKNFANVDLLNISLVYPTSLNVGSYEIDAISDNPNVNLVVSKGRLIINPIYLNPSPVDPELSPAVYGDLLASITFASTSNGVWSWKYPQTIIDRIVGFSAVAIFTPTSNNYKSEERTLEIFDIAKKTLTIKVNEDQNTHTYDGNTHSIIYMIENGEYGDLQVDGNITETNAGTYYANLEINDEFYQGTTRASLIINKAIPDTNFTSHFDVTWFSGITLKDVNIQSETNEYSWKTPNASLDEIKTYTMVAVFTPSDTANYEIVEQEVTVTVGKAAATIDNVQEEYNFVYSGNACLVSGILPSHYEEELLFEYLDNGEPIAQIINAGEYTLKLTLPESTHYYSVEKSAQIIVAKADFNVTLSTLSATYEDTLDDVILLGDDNGEWAWQEDGTTSVGNVGERKHKAIYTPFNPNYNTAEFEATINVVAKKLYFTITQNQFTYSGEKFKVKYTISDIDGRDYSQMSVTGNTGYVNAGRYDISLSVLDGNYLANKDTTLIIEKLSQTPTIPNLTATYLDALKDVTLPQLSDGEWKWLINTDTKVGDVGTNQFDAIFIYYEADGLDNLNDYTTKLAITVNKLSLTKPNLKESSVVFDGKAHTPIVDGEDTDLYTIKLPTETNVGEYQVELTLTDSKNYIWSDGNTYKTYLPYEILRAQAKIENLSISNWTYGEQANEPTYTYSDFVKEEVLIQYIDSQGQTTTTQPTNVGKYTIKITISDTKNYQGTSKEQIFEIFSKEITIPQLSQSKVTYDDQTHTAMFDNFEEVYYIVNNNTFKNVDVYKVELVLRDKVNYVWTTGNSENIYLDFEIVKAQAYITKLEISSWIYGQEPCEPNITKSDFVSDDDVEIKYYLGETLLENAPINAGAYTLKVTILETDNYYGDYKEVEFEITKAQVMLPRLDNPTFVFDGTEHAPNVIDTSETNKELYTYSLESQIDVGEYFVQLSLIDSDNYIWADGNENQTQLPFSITQAQATLNVTISSWTYGEQAQKPNITKSDFVSDDVVKIEYYLGKTLLENAPTTAGTYTLKVTILETKNYQGVEKTAEFSIHKALVAVPSIASKKYTGELQTADIISNTYYTVDTNNGGVDYGKYDVVLSLVDFDNYKWVGYDNQTITLVFEITKAINEWQISPSISGWPYGSVPSEPQAKATFGEVKVSYKLSSASDSTYTEVVPQNAGSYIAKFFVAGSDDYNELSATMPFEIAKASVVVPSLVKTSVVYNGNMQLAEISPSSELYQITQNGWTNVGKYQVTVTLTDSQNYIWSNDELQNISLDFEITKATAQVAIAEIPNITYGDELSEPQVTYDSFVKASDVSKQYLRGETIISDDPTDVGEYTFRVTISDDSDGNYIGATAERRFRITPKAIAVPTLTQTEFTYSGEPHTASTTDESELFTITENTHTEVGEYQAKLTISSDNYIWQDTNSKITYLDFKIVKAQAEITIEISDKTFDGVPVVPNIGNSTFVSQGKITITYSDGENTFATAPTDVGEYTLTATITETNNYTGATATKPFSITPAEVLLPSLQEESITYDGKTHTPQINHTNQSLYNTYDGVNEYTNVGNYKITFSLNSTNYVWSEIGGQTFTLTFAITKAQAVIEQLDIDGWIYEQTANTPIIEVSDFVKDNYTVTYYKGKTLLTGVPTDVGEYIIKVIIPSTNNYDGAETTANFEIKSKVIQVPTLDKTTYVFDNQSHTPSIVDDSESNKSCYTASIESGTNVGTYYATLTLNNDNYIWSSGEKSTTKLQFTITKAPIEIILLEQKNWTYGQTAPDYTIKYNVDFVEDSMVTINYLDSQGNVLTQKPSQVGEYSIKAVVSSTQNYIGTWESKNFSITPVQVATPQISPSSVTYTGETQFATVATNDNYTISGNVGWIEVGKYNLTATLKDKNNYVWAKTQTANDLTLEFEITKIQTSITSLSLASWIYSATPNEPQATANHTFVMPEEIIYKYYDSNKNELSTKPTSSGTYYVTAEVQEATNYTSAKSNYVEFKIEQCTPAITYTITDDEFYMNYDNLEEKITSKTAQNLANNEIDGTWTYGDITYAHGDNASYFYLKFTPSDTINYKTIDTKVNLTVHTTAHIDSTTYYPTIERATASAVSSNTIYVLPDTTGKVVIAKDISIISGVTMVLLYGSTIDDRNASGEALGDGKYYAPSNNTPETYRKTLVKLLKGKTITLAGTLEIAGELSGAYGGCSYAGNTGRDYAELIMCENSKINVTGSLKVTGYLTEELSSIQNSTDGNGSQINVTTGSIYLPFVLRDFKGGSYMYAVYNRIEESGWISKKAAMECSTFNQYQLINVYPLLNISYNGKVLGYANLYASDKNNYTQINLIGNTNSNLIQLTDGTYSSVVAKYDKTNDKNIIDIYGGMTLNSLSLSIQTGLTGISKISVSTEKVYFPINWAFDISLNKAQGQASATFKLEQKIKIMPGAKVVIGEGVSATMSNVSIYNGYTDQNTKPKPFYPEKDDPIFIVNGSLVCANIGGKVSSTKAGATIKVTSSSSITTHETKGEVSGSSISASVEFCDITQSLTLLGSTDVTSITTNTIYTYNGTTWE